MIDRPSYLGSQTRGSGKLCVNWCGNSKIVDEIVLDESRPTVNASLHGAGVVNPRGAHAGRLGTLATSPNPLQREVWIRQVATVGRCEFIVTPLGAGPS